MVKKLLFLVLALILSSGIANAQQSSSVTVQGIKAAGTLIGTTRPVPIAGIDDTGTIRTLLLGTDGSLSVVSSGADGAILDGVSASIKATVRDYTNSNPLSVVLTDTNGDYIAAGAGTQYTEDAAAAANPIGTALILVRTDTPAAQVTTNGDNVAQRGTDYGAAYVQIVTSAGAYVDSFGGGVQYTEADTDASITGTALMLEGAANALVAAVGGAGAVSTAVQRVTLASDDPAVALLTTIDADTGNLAAIAASLSVLDDFDETDRAKVNVIVGQAGITAGAGAVAANTPRVTLASNDPAVALLTTIDADTSLLSALILATQADNVANTADGLQVTNFNMVFDGTTWDRQLGDATNGTLVNLGANNDVTVTGTVTVTDGAGALNTIVDSGTLTAVTTITNAVTVTDGSGSLNVICDSGCSGGTQYAIGAVSGATDTVTMAGAIRDDALATLADADGDVVGVRVTSTGALWVQSSVTDAAEDAAVATNPVPIGGVYRTASVTLDNGDVGYPRIDVDANLQVVGTGTAGTAAGGVLTIQGVASMTPVLVGDGTGALNVICDSGCSGGTQYAVDTALGATPTVTLAGAIRDDALATLTPAEGDAIGLRVDSVGALWAAISGSVTVTDGSGALNVIVDSGTITANLGATDNAVLDDIADGIAVTNAGTFVVQENGAALTALQLLDDAVYVDDADWTDDTSKHLLVGGIYQATPQTITDGDVAPISIDANGSVRIVGAISCSNCSGSGASAVDDAAFTVGTDSVAPAGFLYDADGSDVVQDNDVGLARMTVDRVLLSTIWDAAGNERGLNIDANGAIAAVVSDGSGALNVIIDSGTTTVTQATAANLNVTVTDGSGALNVIVDSITAGNNNIGDVDVATIAAGDNNIGNVDIVSFPDNEPINVAQINGVTVLMGNGASGTGAQRVTIANDSTGILAGVTTVSTVTNLSQFGGAAINLGSGTIGTGTLRINIATDDPVNDALVNLDVALNADEGAFTYATTQVLAIGAVAESTTDALADGTVGAPVMTLTRAIRTAPTGYLSGGGTPVSYVSAGATEDEHAVCTGPCTVYSITAFNHTAASAFLRCEADTAGNTTPGSETNASGEPDLEIPASTTGAGFTITLPIGASFPTALTCWIVSDEASSGTTEVAANDVRVWYTISQ